MSCSGIHDKQFDDKDPGAIELFSFDFAPILQAGETVDSLESEMVGGPDAQNMLSGIPILSGTVASQMVIGGLAKHTYHLTIWATTSLGQRLPLCADIPVVDPRIRVKD